MLEPLIGLVQHNVREGWMAWVWKTYSECGRHEVQSLPVSDQDFLSLDVENIRSWILSSPVAATVGLGATFRLLLPRGGAMPDYGSTSLGIVQAVFVLSLLNRLVLILLDLAGPKKLHALMRSWRFDAGWPSAKTASGAQRNRTTKVFLCATSTMGWCTIQSLLLAFNARLWYIAVPNGFYLNIYEAVLHLTLAV